MICFHLWFAALLLLSRSLYHNGWYCDLLVVGRKNNANATAAMMTKKAVMACSPTHPVPLVFALLVKILVEPASSSSAAAGVIVLDDDVVVFDELFRFRVCFLEINGFSVCGTFFVNVVELRSESSLTVVEAVNANRYKASRTTVINCCILLIVDCR